MKRKIPTILLVYIPAGAVLASILLVTLFKWVPVHYTPLMLKRSLQADGASPVKHVWTRIEDISDDMVFAVISAEDQRFPDHNGFDLEELMKMMKRHISEEKPIRGCSTISQQTAKNCFTWCTDTWLRKAIETYYTVLIELIWGKHRILEVYLNVAEMGPGIYGAESAAMHYFNIHASELTFADAGSLACCLPNPLHRTPDWVNKHMAHERQKVIDKGWNFEQLGNYLELKYGPIF